MNDDMVNHPKHYEGMQITLECNDIKRWMPSGLSDAFKYVWRAGNKGSEQEDLKKAQWYINDLLTNAAMCSEGQVNNLAYFFRPTAMAFMEHISKLPIPEGPNEQLRRWTLQVLVKGELYKASNYIQDWLNNLEGKTVSDALYSAILTTIGCLRQEFVKKFNMLPDKEELLELVEDRTGYTGDQAIEVIERSNFALRKEPK